MWSGVSYAETAAVLGVPFGTVRSRLSRARKRLSKPAVEELSKSREPLPHNGQVQGGRTSAVRSHESYEEGSE
ncbi:sigma-70-like protein [Streptomyces sp. T12]|nr:sigma factor-like helix-turn-helix DNA-binding protein [Streptomyces sp. T12]TWD17431.1 sigma-70-like protein [Streptomyces sp. T12]